MITKTGNTKKNTSCIEEKLTVLMHICYKEAKPDLLALYLLPRKKEEKNLVLYAFKGIQPEPDSLPLHDQNIEFMRESKESLCLLQKKESPFSSILLGPDMHSGIASPFFTPSGWGVMFLNYLHPYQSTFRRLELVEKYIKTTLPVS